MEDIRKIILYNIYKIKWYFDQGVRQITWITGKLPELMSVVYLGEKFGLVIREKEIILIAVIGGLILVTFGIILKRTGLYDTEMYVDASKNPVQNEILTAARIIIRRGKNGR